uniref:Uncharacterized protein n=1 Tax=Arundo donax TaxID=35708 RepID=A0A0A9BEG1_ARUDO
MTPLPSPVLNPPLRGGSEKLRK